MYPDADPAADAGDPRRAIAISGRLIGRPAIGDGPRGGGAPGCDAAAARRARGAARTGPVRAAPASSAFGAAIACAALHRVAPTVRPVRRAAGAARPASMGRAAAVGHAVARAWAEATTEIARVDPAPIIAIAGCGEACRRGAALQNKVGGAADDRADGAANALHGGALGRDLAHDALGLCLVVNGRARCVHHLHRAATQQSAAACASAQLCKGHSHRHAQLLSLCVVRLPSPLPPARISIGKSKTNS